jgi:inosose dehydratase
MRIGYNTWSMATVPYSAFIPCLAEIGFGAIAISVVPGYQIGGQRVENAAALDRLTADDRQKIRTAFKERDLKLPSIIGNQSLVNEDAEARRKAVDILRRGIDLCVELAIDEVPTFNTGTGGVSGDLEDARKQAWIVEGLVELADHAQKRGVVVCIEPHVNATIDTIERAERLLELVPSPALRLDFDVSHFEVQAIPMEQSVPRLAPLAAAAEVKDQHCRPLQSPSDDAGDWRVSGNGTGYATAPDGRELEFQFLLAGEGTFDLARYLRLMTAHGFDRPIAFEASVQCQARPGYDALASAADIYRWMASAWQTAGISTE